MKITIATFAILFCCMFNQFSVAQINDQRSKINVKGDAELKVIPDQVIISLSVETSDMDIDKARADNDSKVHAVLAMARKLGIENKQLQTDYLNVEPRYDYKNSEKRFLGYFVTKNITVTLKDIPQMDKLIAESLKLGTNYVQSVDFKSSDFRKYQDEARLQAIRAAKEKATSLAAELGMKIKKPILITDDPVYQTTARGNRNMTHNYSSNAVMNSTLVSPEEGSTIAPGEISIRAQVSVTFEME